MSFQIQNIDILKLHTPEEVRDLAQKLADMGESEGEREDRLFRKMRIRAKIFGAEMTPFRWCIGHVPSLQISKRVNGQHSSEVFLELTPEEWQHVPFPVYVYWEEYSCDIEVDIAILFEQFDARWSARNRDDLIGVHISLYDDLREAISSDVARHVTDGIQWYRQKALGYKASAESQFTLIHENHDIHAFLLWCGQNLSIMKTREMLHPKATIAAMYHCMRDGNPHAPIFWKQVSLGKAGNDAGTIEYLVAHFLELYQLCKVAEDWPVDFRRQLKGAKKVTEYDLFATCLRAFAAVMKGQKVNDIFTLARNRKVPELIATLYPGLPPAQAA